MKWNPNTKNDDVIDARGGQITFWGFSVTFDVGGNISSFGAHKTGRAKRGIWPLSKRPRQPIQCPARTEGTAMRRREFIALMGSGMAAWPSLAAAQGSANFTIGYLSSKDEKSEAGIIAGIRKGLAAQGLTEGQNFSILYAGVPANTNACPGLPPT